MIEHVKCI